MKHIITVVLVISTIIGVFSVTTSIQGEGTKYSVFCANDKVEVDSRTLEQMKSARGSSTCLIKEFDYSSDADDYAKSIGGKDSRCSCN